MNIVHILALDLMIDLTKDKSQKVLLGTVLHMLMSVDFDEWGKWNPNQRKSWMQQFVNRKLDEKF